MTLFTILPVTVHSSNKEICMIWQSNSLLFCLARLTLSNWFHVSLCHQTVFLHCSYGIWTFGCVLQPVWAGVPAAGGALLWVDNGQPSARTADHPRLRVGACADGHYCHGQPGVLPAQSKPWCLDTAAPPRSLFWHIWHHKVLLREKNKFYCEKYRLSNPNVSSWVWNSEVNIKYLFIK